MFVRFQSPLPGKRGVHTGVFGLTNLLGRAGDLSPSEHCDWREGNDWFNSAYPDPGKTDPDVYDEDLHPKRQRGSRTTRRTCWNVFPATWRFSKHTASRA